MLERHLERNSYRNIQETPGKSSIAAVTQTTGTFGWQMQRNAKKMCDIQRRGKQGVAKVSVVGLPCWSYLIPIEHTNSWTWKMFKTILCILNLNFDFSQWSLDQVRSVRVHQNCEREQRKIQYWENRITWNFGVPVVHKSRLKSNRSLLLCVHSSNWL